MKRAYTKDSRDIPGICRTPVYEILYLLGGMDKDSTHTVELIEVTSNEPPEDFTDCGHQTAGELAAVAKFATAAGADLLCCSINAQSTDRGTHWIIGCYYPTGFYDKYISRGRPVAGKPGNMIVYKWAHDLYITDSDGLRHNMGHWITQEYRTHTEGTDSPTDTHKSPEG